MGKTSSLLRIEIIKGEHKGDICDVLDCGGGNGRGSTHLKVKNQNGEIYNLKKRGSHGLRYKPILVQDVEEFGRVHRERLENNRNFKLTESLKHLGELYEVLKSENEMLKYQLSIRECE